MTPVSIKRVRISNYRSIAGCDVALGPLSFLVGPNGSGKSNFLDALRLTTDALQTTLDHALRDRGGIKQVRRRSSGHPTHFAIRLDVFAPDWVGHYAFRVGARQAGAYEVLEEEAVVDKHDLAVPRASFKRAGMSVVSTEPVAGGIPAPDRLYLVLAAGLEAFRPLYDVLSQMGFYNLNPQAMRELQSPDVGELLKRDGSNLASVLDRLAGRAPLAKKRIEDYLSKVVPGIVGVDYAEVGHKESVEFRQVVAGASSPWRFPAGNMSDGTLRALGVLVALFQQTPRGGPSLIGLEEPEVALHPAAAAVLLDALNEASAHRQVLVTSHSPELLDDPGLPTDSILAVNSRDGDTEIAPLDEPGRLALREGLFTPGELLRANQIIPDPHKSQPLTRQMRLFEAS